MTKKKTRVTRAQSTPSHHDRRTFPILVILVMGVIVLGMFQYTGLLVAGSAIFVGFFGWLWWARRNPRASVSKRKAPARSQRKPRARRRAA